MILPLALGLAIGIVMALTGAGGGILAVPLLLLAFPLGVAEAAPIGLLAVSLASGAGVLLGLRSGIVRYRAALLMAGVGTLTAPVGVWLAHRSDDRLLFGLFATVLGFVAWSSVYQTFGARRTIEPDRRQPCVQDDQSGRFVWTARCARYLAASGSLTGLVSGLLGVGGGFVIVPALRQFTTLDMRSTIATSLAVIAIVSLAAVLTNITMDRVDWALGVPFATGALAGMIGGRWLAVRLPQEALQLGFAAICALVAGGMGLSAVLR